MSEFRLVRILEYTGTRDFIARSIQERAVKVQIETHDGGVIREAFTDKLPLRGADSAWWNAEGPKLLHLYDHPVVIETYKEDV